MGYETRAAFVNLPIGFDRSVKLAHSQVAT